METRKREIVRVIPLRIDMPKMCLKRRVCDIWFESIVISVSRHRGARHACKCAHSDSTLEPFSIFDVYGNEKIKNTRKYHTHLVFADDEDIYIIDTNGLDKWCEKNEIFSLRLTQIKSISSRERAKNMPTPRQRGKNAAAICSRCERRRIERNFNITFATSHMLLSLPGLSDTLCYIYNVAYFVSFWFVIDTRENELLSLLTFSRRTQYFVRLASNMSAAASEKRPNKCVSKPQITFSVRTRHTHTLTAYTCQFYFRWQQRKLGIRIPAVACYDLWITQIFHWQLCNAYRLSANEW